MMMRMKYAVLASACLLPWQAWAAVCDSSNYGFAFTVVNPTAANNTTTACTKTAAKLFDMFNASSLRTLQGNYTDSSVAGLDINFNSLPIRLDFNTPGTPLRLQIAALGVDQTFTGTSRDDSVHLLKDYVKKSDLAGRIMRYQVSNSASSPISGPTGLIPTVASQDFAAVFDAPTQLSGGTAAAEANNLIGMGAEGSTGKTNGKKASVYTIPVSYTWRSNATPGKMLSLGASVSQTKTEGAVGYHAGLGLSARVPITADWALLPSVRYSVTGSVDLNTVAGVYSAALGSAYHIPLRDLDLVIGNMVGYYKTSALSIGDYSFDPNVSTLAWRNGVMLSQPMSWGSAPLSLEYYVVDTRYSGGTKFFVDNVQEFGVTVGSNRAGDVRNKYFRFGLKYTRGRDTNAVGLQGNYWF